MFDKKTQKLLNKGLFLPIMEHFYTIQGEGYHTGKSTYFIRVGGCDVGCHWCDVKESWDATKHPLVDVKKVVSTLKNFSNLVVVTGGEPLTWDMKYLTQSLKERNMMVHLETSGSFLLTGFWDWICLSPKKNKDVHPSIYNYANELKVIVYNDSDFDFAETHAKKVLEHCKLYLQPEWSRRERVTPKIIDYVKRYPKWRISIQTHKYLKIP